MKAVREAKTPKMSAQMLADRTRDLGHHIRRAVIANLESGRRGSVTVADIYVLAQALNVPPLALLAPLDREEDVEVLPGVPVEAWDALGWLVGDKYLGELIHRTEWETSTPRELLALWVDYRIAERDLAAAILYARTKTRSIEDVETARRLVEGRAAALDMVRNDLLANGAVSLPPLSSDRDE